jgi:hypothetical protein
MTNTSFAFAWDRTRPAREEAADPLASFPTLTSRHVALRPINPADYASLQLAEVSGEIGHRWRFRGQTPSPEHWAANLWNGVLSQYLVWPTRGGDPAGLVMAYQASFQDGHAYVAATRLNPDNRSPALMLGLALFLEYLFGTWAFDKLYFEVPEYNLHQFGSSIGRLLKVEAQLRDHYRYGDRMWDKLTLALYRSDWKASPRPALRLAHGPQPVRARLNIPTPAHGGT